MIQAGTHFRENYNLIAMLIQFVELTYIEVAEKIYHAHDHLIVGQVNCDKYEQICRQYNVNGVPTILYIRGDNQVKYSGLREVKSIVSFAERMNGPDTNYISDCNQIIPEVDRRGLIIIYSAGRNLPGDIHKAFISIAAHMKRDFWFYKLYNETCMKDFSLAQTESVFIVKRNLKRWIRFETKDIDDPEAALTEFIRKESFPIFGPLSNQMMNTTKLLAVAVLDEYGPANRLDLMSKKFYKVFEQFAIEEAQNNDDILFAWSTDLYSIKKIALSHVKTPNVVLIKPDMSHNMLVKLDSDQKVFPEQQLPESLSKRALSQFIQAARRGELEFTGGDTYYHRLARYIYSYVIFVRDRYEANPVLTSLMLISMATTIVVLLYKTKNYMSDDEEDIEVQGVRQETNHRKQD